MKCYAYSKLITNDYINDSIKIIYLSIRLGYYS